MCTRLKSEPFLGLVRFGFTTGRSGRRWQRAFATLNKRSHVGRINPQIRPFRIPEIYSPEFASFDPGFDLRIANVKEPSAFPERQHSIKSHDLSHNSRYLLEMLRASRNIPVKFAGVSREMLQGSCNISHRKREAARAKKLGQF